MDVSQSYWASIFECTLSNSKMTLLQLVKPLFVFPQRGGNSPRGMDFWQSCPAVTSFSSGSWPAELFQSVTFIATKAHVLFGFIKFPLTLQRVDQTHSCRESKANPSPFFKSIQDWSELYVMKALPRFRPHNLVSVGKEKKKNSLVLVSNGSPFATGRSCGVARVSMATQYKLL